MLKLLSGKSVVASAQRQLENTLYEQLPERSGEYTIGFQGGNFNVSGLHADHKIWFMPKKISGESSPRFWNAFGVSEKLKLSSSNTITVEINIPVTGENSSVAGLFAQDERDGGIYLLHRGKIGGGKSGVGKQAFLEWGKLSLTPVKTSENKIIEAVLIGRLDSPSLSKEIARFVNLVAEFKEFISNKEWEELPDKELEITAQKGKRKPAVILVETTSFVRSQAVAEYVKRRAKGRCDLCNESAPFIDAKGKPYLESHHIQWLVNGGSDKVENACALCPNCHRKMHIVGSLKDIKTLENKASKQITRAT